MRIHGCTDLSGFRGEEYTCTELAWFHAQISGFRGEECAYTELAWFHAQISGFRGEECIYMVSCTDL